MLEFTEERTLGDVKYGEEVDRGGRVLAGLFADVISVVTAEKRESFEVGMKARVSSLRAAGDMMLWLYASQV